MRVIKAVVPGTSLAPKSRSLTCAHTSSFYGRTGRLAVFSSFRIASLPCCREDTPHQSEENLPGEENAPFREVFPDRILQKASPFVLLSFVSIVSRLGLGQSPISTACC